MKELGNCPTGDTIREMVQKRQMLQDETVPVLFLSTALLAAAAHVLAELDDDNELGMVLIISDEDALNPESSLELYPEMDTFAGMRSLIVSLEQDELPDLVFDKIPYWKQVNDHPRGPVPNQRKGGKGHRPQKHKR
jgi:hypothetical protein